MGRFLMYISYIGTGFSGIQKQTGRPVKSVVGLMENVLFDLRPANTPNVTVSSRTDRGVHALCNTVHVDLQHGTPGKDYDPDHLTSALNEYFFENMEDVRVLKTLLVNDNFHCRYNVQRRTYVYRICLVHRLPPHDFCRTSHSPFEQTRCLIIRKDVDMDLVRKAATILSGRHDYRSFTRPKQLIINPQPTVRTVNIRVETGAGFLVDYVPSTLFPQKFEYWNFVFEAHSFLNKQVRKMTGVMLAAGRKEISLDEVQQLIDSPGSDLMTKTMAYDVPAYGLYLTGVEYNEKDLSKPSKVGATGVEV